MKIHFFGAAGEVTGSCYLIESREKKILVDCGLFQGAHSADERNHAAFAFDPVEIDAVIVTHAHLDHCGRVPLLFARGFRGQVFATEPSAELLKLQWDDTLEVMRMDLLHHQHPMLFEAVDVERAKDHLHPLLYDKPHAITDEMSFVLHDAGHIFGSAWVEFRSHGQVAVFSGDIGNDHVPIVHETTPLVPCDVLITEATYGDRLHDSPRLRRHDLREKIIEAVTRGGTMMIAAFSIERTQEILFELDQLIRHERSIPHIPIYLDSPLAIRANEVYRHFPQYFDEQASAEYRAGEDFLAFPGLRVTKTVDESKSINSAPSPKIIIAGSGMLAGGRIMHHLMRYLPDPNSTLLLVSYQADGTIGRKIQEGARMIMINGEQIPVRCHLARMDSYSAHGDQEKLIQWMSSAPSLPKQVVVVHSDPPSAAAFVQIVKNKLHIPAEAARPEQIVEI